MTEQEITDTSHEKDESQTKNVPQAGNNVKQAGQQPHAPGPTDANAFGHALWPTLAS